EALNPGILHKTRQLSAMRDLGKFCRLGKIFLAILSSGCYNAPFVDFWLSPMGGVGRMEEVPKVEHWRTLYVHLRSVARPGRIASLDGEQGADLAGRLSPGFRAMQKSEQALGGLHRL